MRQAIHIFRKDVRHLWPAILAVMTLTGLFAYVGALSLPLMQNSSTLDRYNSLIQFVLLLGWWYLIAAVIHEEVLPGHQQFWLTRPYSWKSLLAAKGLFILAFVNVPKLLADCVILQVHGFHAASYWPGLIASQVLFTAVWLLPYAALAAITRNLRQFSLAVLMVWVVLIFLPLFFTSHPSRFALYSGHSFGATWIHYFIIIAILLIASLLVLLCQYSQRRTVTSRMMALSAILLVFGISQLISVHALMTLQTRLSKSLVDASPIQIGMDPTRKRLRTVGTGSPQGTIQIDIPVQVTGLAEGTDLYSDSLTAEIEGPDGKTFQAPGTIVHEDDGFWQRIYVDQAVFQQLREERVTLRTSTYLTLLGDRSTTQIESQGKGTEVPGLGICRFSQHGESFMLVCFAPFRRSSLFAKTFFSHMEESHPYVEPGSYSPYPAEAGINPLVVSVRSSGSSSATLKPTIVTQASLTHSRHDYLVRELCLGDYAISE